MAKIDVTGKIEQLEVFEERLGVKLESLSAFFDDDGTDTKHLIIHGEFHPLNGTELQEDIELIVAVYDTSGRVVGTASHYYVAEDFFGFETFSIGTYLPISNISKIRIYPQKV